MSDTLTYEKYQNAVTILNSGDRIATSDEANLFSLQNYQLLSQLGKDIPARQLFCDHEICDPKHCTMRKP